MTELLFKVLDKNARSCNGGRGEWHKPRGRPGKWMPPIEGDLEPCANGYHLCRRDDLLDWLGPTIWLAEYKGDRVNDDDKIVVRQARLIRKLNWDARIARHFAADCAWRSLKFFEKEHPNDKRPREYINVARRFADGKATQEELDAAARAAALTLAGWFNSDSITANRAAARAAARGAAWGAERKWQTNHLMRVLRAYERV